MPIALVVTFMDKGPPKVRRKYSIPPLEVEPEDKTIILDVAGGRRAIFQIDDQWFQNYIKNNMLWAVGKIFKSVDHGSSITVTWD